jgi:hypothetical protein
MSGRDVPTEAGVRSAFMSTRSLSPILLAALVAPAMVSLPAGDALAQAFEGKVRPVRVQEQPETFDYGVTVTTVGDAVEEITDVEVYLEEGSDGVAPEDNPIQLDTVQAGWELLAPNGGDPIEAGVEYSLSLTPLGADGSPVGETVYLDGTHALGDGAVQPATTIEWEPFVFYDIILMRVVDDLDCSGCIAVELTPALGTPEDAQPGGVHIEGESVASADTADTSASADLSAGPTAPAAPPRLLDAVSESLVQTRRWSASVNFNDPVVGHGYGATASVNNNGYVVDSFFDIIVYAAAPDTDTGPTPTVIIDGIHEGDLEVGTGDVALLTGTVTGHIVVGGGGTLILSGSTVEGDISTEGDAATVLFSDHFSYGSLYADADDSTFAGEDEGSTATFLGSFVGTGSTGTLTGGSMTFSADAEVRFSRNIQIMGQLVIGTDCLIVTNDSDGTIAIDGVLSAAGSVDGRARNGGDISIDGTLSAGTSVDIRSRGDGGTLSVSGDLSAGTDAVLRTTGDGGDLTVTGSVTAGMDLDVRTTGDGAVLSTTWPVRLVHDEFGPGRVILTTRGRVSPIVIQNSPSIGDPVHADVVVRVTGDDSSLTVNDPISATGDVDMRLRADGAGVATISANITSSEGDVVLRGHGDGGISIHGGLTAELGHVDLRVRNGGDLFINDTVLAPEGEIFLRARHGGDIVVPCDLTVERGICLLNGASISMNGNDDITVGVTLDASIVDLDAGADLTLDGDVTGDDTLLRAGRRRSGTVRVVATVEVRGWASIEAGGGDIDITGTVSALGAIDLLAEDGGVVIDGVVENWVNQVVDTARADVGVISDWTVVAAGASVGSNGDVSIDSTTTTEIRGDVDAQDGIISIDSGAGTTLGAGATFDWNDAYGDLYEDTVLSSTNTLFTEDGLLVRNGNRNPWTTPIVSINIYDGDRNRE